MMVTNGRNMLEDKLTYVFLKVVFTETINTDTDFIWINRKPDGLLEKPAHNLF
jgi:hypothetical protein